METVTLAGCTAQSAAVGLLLDALSATDVYDQIVVPALPCYTIHVPERDAIIAVTTAQSPLFAAPLEAIAAERRLDVVLLRLDDSERGITPIGVDIALGSLPCSIWAGRGFKLYRDAHSTWLVPGHFGLSVSISRDGFNLELVAPYATLAGRAAGIARAGRDLARALQGGDVR